MAIPGVITAQTGGREFNGKNLTKYSLFVGGLNTTHHALENYSPLLNGFGRLFMVRPPYALLKRFAGSSGDLYSSDSLFIQFKHIMEYMNRSVSGFGNKTLEVASTPIQGGFAGRQFSVPTVTRDETTEFTVGLYELDGLPIMTVIEEWMNMIGDEGSGLATYGGLISGGQDENGLEKRLYRRTDEKDDGIAYNEANHTAEFIYVAHDRSGAQSERAVLITDVFPKSIDQGQVLNSETGSHNVVQYELTFNCSIYRSSIITAIANDLLKQYRIVSNSLNFNPELGDAVYAPNTVDKFSRSLGSIPVDSATGTNIGNVPVYAPTNTPKTVEIGNKDMNAARLAGQPGREVQENWDGFAETQ